jgi:hypothetical protein
MKCLIDLNCLKGLKVKIGFNKDAQKYEMVIYYLKTTLYSNSFYFNNEFKNITIQKRKIIERLCVRIKGKIMEKEKEFEICTKG